MEVKLIEVKNESYDSGDSIQITLNVKANHNERISLSNFSLIEEKLSQTLKSLVGLDDIDLYILTFSFYKNDGQQAVHTYSIDVPKSTTSNNLYKLINNFIIKKCGSSKFAILNLTKL